MCYKNCYYYPCIHTPGAYTYRYGPVWSTPEYTVYSPSSAASSVSDHATAGSSSYRRYSVSVADEEELLRSLRRERRNRNARGDDEVYNVSVRYRSSSGSSRSSGRRSRSPSPSSFAPNLLPQTYYAFMPTPTTTTTTRRVRVSLYD